MTLPFRESVHNSSTVTGNMLEQSLVCGAIVIHTGNRHVTSQVNGKAIWRTEYTGHSFMCKWTSGSQCLLCKIGIQNRI